LREAVDRQARQEGTKRSSLIQKAVRVYLVLSKRTALKALLKQGYLEMQEETQRIEREFAKLDQESLKYVD